MKTRTKEQKDAIVLMTSIFFMIFAMMIHKMKRKNAKFLDKKIAPYFMATQKVYKFFTIGTMRCQ